MTTLVTRRSLEDSPQRELLRVDRRQSNLALAILRLDNFDAFWTVGGHAAANILPQAAAKLAKSRIRREDIGCYHDNNEFAFVTLDASAEIASLRAEELRAAIKMLGWCHGSKLPAPSRFCGRLITRLGKPLSTAAIAS